MKLKGKALKYGDNIDTDVIIPGKYTKTLNMKELADHVMEDLDPDFKNKLQNGDFLVAGHNFGCGSSREQAPLALKHAGVSCIIAESFARIFYRNAINIGLPLIECKIDEIKNGDILEYVVGSSKLHNLTTQKIIEVKPLPQIMTSILKEGGLVNYLKKYGCYKL
ncbi:MAG: 3-isopropylmalate/(R)-2-methylmalate dehydratase small subunit [Thermosediminibacterales bacterium]|nr:3-isopropylmalate/(R)-2-methylmalate dehydratase small subunit [Thermosediminibacterales bacterium]MDK2836374.1 3-isopropylmalate/(R)-2-methylmalate dehydratase small subunit [Thermosediminibacterales bacterium]